MKKHNYEISLEWTGNKGSGTFDYRSYGRNHQIKVENKHDPILGSSDPSFRGDSTRYNPEELFVSSISACHMLWYLHLCSTSGVIVTEYQDKALGIMEEDSDGKGRFNEVTLHPKIVVSESSMIARAKDLHHEANKMCFIANSLNIAVGHEATITSLQ